MNGGSGYRVGATMYMHQFKELISVCLFSVQECRICSLICDMHLPYMKANVHSSSVQANVLTWGSLGMCHLLGTSSTACCLKLTQVSA